MPSELARALDCGAGRGRRIDQPLPPPRAEHDSTIRFGAGRRIGFFTSPLRWLALASMALLVASAGCAENPISPTVAPPFSQTDEVVGTGADAATGLTVTVNYTGWVYDSTQPNQRGAQFDSSIGKTPFSFVLGANSVIQGWEQGVPGMKVGGSRLLVIPPSLAYGGTRTGPIPPFATLIFEISLVDVQ